MIRKTYFIGCLVLAFSIFANAQSDSESNKAKSVRGKKAWFLTVDIPSDIDNPVDVQLGDKMEKVTLSLRSMSDPMKVPADGIIKMVKPIPDPADPEKTILRTLAQAQVGEGISEAIIICVPNDKESGPLFKTKVFNMKDFGGGDSLFINLSPKKLGVSLGKEEINLPPGKVGTIDLKGLAKSTQMPIGYHIFNEEKKSWSVFSASTIMVRPTRREICIFSWDPNFKRVTFRGVTFPVPTS